MDFSLIVHDSRRCVIISVAVFYSCNSCCLIITQEVDNKTHTLAENMAVVGAFSASILLAQPTSTLSGSWVYLGVYFTVSETKISLILGTYVLCKPQKLIM